MQINWFPGHMAKSTREIKQNLEVCDCVVYVLDSRAVRSCFNPDFDAVINVPVLYVLNKADMVPPSAVKAWTAALAANDCGIVAVGAINSASRSALLAAVKEAAKARLEKQKNRGLNAHIRAMVIGVPNTGKSTLINLLCKSSALETGNKAGVTRNARWARVDGMLDLLDTPGTLYPKIHDRTVAENLAIVGSIKDELIDFCEIAIALISRLNKLLPEVLYDRYKCTETGMDGLEQIAQSRGYKARGGVYDTERAAHALIDDFRKGRLGKIALEYPHDKP